MNKTFNLFLLHQPTDVHPRSWISFKGDSTKIIFNNLEKTVLTERGWCREKLSRKMGKLLNCSHSTIKQMFQGKHEFYPIIVILKLLEFTKYKRKFLKSFKEDIKYLKVNSASSKPLKAVHRSNENIAKILGAFMADGSLSARQAIASNKPQHLYEIKQILTRLEVKHSNIKHIASRKQYSIDVGINQNSLKVLNVLLLPSALRTQSYYNIELTEEYKDNVEAFIKWIKQEFDINPTFFKKKKNAWRTTFSNKILARYLIVFFGVTPGPKTYSAFEPNVIKISSLKIRKSFAMGVLMFDGCVSMNNKITLGLRSKKLINDIKEIWEHDNINFGITENKEKKETVLFTTAKNNIEKLEQYFEKNTQKSKLLKWMEGDLSQKIVIKENSSIASVNSFFKVIQDIKCCDTLFVSQYFKCNHYTARNYLKILKKQKRITLSKKPTQLGIFVSPNTTVLLKKQFHTMIFVKVRKTFKTDKNLADFINIKKATFSAWRLRKNRIPLHIIKRICKILNIDLKKIHSNIQKTDREIAEII